MRDTARTPTSHHRPDAYFVVTVASSGDRPYTVENDSAWVEPDAQWREIVNLVASGEWEDVIGCDYIHRANGTCEDKLIKLANAVDYYAESRGEDHPESVRDWIESITGDEAFVTEATRRRIRDEQRADYAIDLARGK